MKKTSLFLLLIIGLNTYAQQQQTLAQEKTINHLNSIQWSLIFNDFDVIIPVAVFIPLNSFSFFGFGSFNFINKNALTKSNFETEDMFSTKNILQKELSSLLNTSFFNYLPSDSIMKLDAFYTNTKRLLFSIETERKDNLFTLDYLLPNQEKGEKIAFDEFGRCIYRTKYNDLGEKKDSYYYNASSSVKRTSSYLMDYILLEEREFDNDVIKEVKTFKEMTSNHKKKRQSAYRYTYNTDGTLDKILELNRKNKVKESIDYIYQNDTLRLINKYINKENDNYIAFGYENGRCILKKVVILKDQTYTFTYEYANDKISSLTYVKKYKNIIENELKYDFDYNVDGLLSSVKSFNMNFNVGIKNQYLFTYNTKKNLRSIKVVNRRGVVDKEIRYDIDFK